MATLTKCFVASTTAIGSSSSSIKYITTTTTAAAKRAATSSSLRRVTTTRSVFIAKPNKSKLTNRYKQDRFLSTTKNNNDNPTATAVKDGTATTTKAATTESTTTTTSASSSSSATSTPDEPPTAKNVALAAVLFGFVGFVFTYSMNAVGKASQGDINNTDVVDPLAQLKAEAQEAREFADPNKRRLSQEEIDALESGFTGGDGDDENNIMEIAVAAPAEIAQLEEEENLRIFAQKKRKQMQQDEDSSSTASSSKKKPWWRFGF